jgi:hypothetical protein
MKDYETGHANIQTVRSDDNLPPVKQQALPHEVLIIAPVEWA